MSNSIRELLKRPIAYQPIIAKAFGSPNLAVLWSQIYYWSERTKDPEGWVYKTREDLFEETGLTRKNQETARRIGGKMGVLESKRMGQPCTVHFRVNLDRAIELIDIYVKVQPELRRLGIKTENIKGIKVDFKKRDKERKDEEERLKVFDIFKFWNVQGIVDHRKMTDKISYKIFSAMRDYSADEIMEAIKKYAKVLDGKEYFWTYRWTLPEFLQRGLTKFLETPLDNFKIKSFERPKKIKYFYRGDEVVESRGKKFVIHDGEWLEFAGDLKDIEKREV